jgi:hypothetical protein
VDIAEELAGIVGRDDALAIAIRLQHFEPAREHDEEAHSLLALLDENLSALDAASLSVDRDAFDLGAVQDGKRLQIAFGRSGRTRIAFRRHQVLKAI